MRDAAPNSALLTDAYPSALRALYGAAKRLDGAESRIANVNASSLPQP